MKQIIQPLKLGDQGPDVANLQDALQLLIDRGLIQLTPPGSPVVNNPLPADRQAQTYLDGTAHVVVLFQQQHQTPVSGAVDAPTTAALNQILKDLGALDAPPTDAQRLVGGQVLAAGLPLAGIVVQAFDKDLRREEPLGPQSPVATDQNGRYAISYTADQFSRAEKASADLVFRLFDLAGCHLRN